MFCLRFDSVGKGCNMCENKIIGIKMISKDIEDKYIEYKLEGWLDSKALYKKNVGELTEKTIIGSFKNKFEISHEDYDELVENHSDIQNIKQKFTLEREEGFETIHNFYVWYKSQKKECGYCGTSAGTLKILFENDKLISKKFTETLHIERKNPNELYNTENCMLACSLCNNSKSDLISEKNYRKYFAGCMGKFLKDLSDGKIENKDEGDGL